MAGGALEYAGYGVDELEPSAIGAAAKTALGMINADTRPVWQLMPFSMPARRCALGPKVAGVPG